MGLQERPCVCKIVAMAELSRTSNELPNDVLFMLDEFGALGSLGSFESAFAIMKGLGIRLWPVLQDFSQLQRAFAPSWQTIVANAGVLQVFGARDVLTANYISERLGMKTAVLVESSKSVGEKTITTTANRYAARRLMNPDEIMYLNNNIGIALADSYEPVQLRK